VEEPTETGGGRRPEGDGEPKPARGGDRRTVELEIAATEDDLHTLQLALTGLREVSRPGQMRLKITVRASRDEGPIDRIAYQNRVLQHLEEDPDVELVAERWDPEPRG
jgi:hypothetical protein